MKQTKITMNLDGLEDIRKKVGKSLKARVGIIGSNGSEDRGGGINQATLGLIQMFGSITNKIPPRDFLLMPIEFKKREVLKSMGGSAARAAFKSGDYRKMFVILGQAAEAAIQEAFATGGFGMWAKNSYETIRRKGSNAPLIDTAELRKSISSDVVNSAGRPV